jgi:deoxyribose-phosphate aldolase
MPVCVEPAILERRADAFTTRRITGASRTHALRLALSMLDLTTLEGRDSPEAVRDLCRRALAPGDGLPPAAAICVYPALIPVAHAVLIGTPVRIASVAAAFPSGQLPLAARLAEISGAVRAGADEIDVVLNRGAFLAGRHAEVTEEIRQMRRACAAGSRSARLKVILETGELETYDNVRRASDLVIAAVSEIDGSPNDGAVFLKTSTGKIAPAATLPATLVMMQAARDHFEATGVRIGIKPAGGIRTASAALAYLAMTSETLGAAWLTPTLFRFGASGLAEALVAETRKGSTRAH